MENKVINVQMDEETFKKFQSGGSTPTELQRNDVNFFDYDGTLLYAYTWDEAKELTELPALPTHDGIEVREWNYTLEDIKAQGTEATIGKADIGACCYDGDGELVMTNGTYIIPRGITRLDHETPYSVPEYHMAKVLSIPATLISVSDTALDGTYIEHLRMPIRVDYELYYNNTFHPVVTKSFWINGYNLDTFIIESIRGLNVVNIPNTFVSFRGFSNSFEDAHIIYMPETIQYIEQFDFAGKHACVIFNNHKIVPVLNSSSYSGSATFVVPDDLYDEWLASTNWANLEYSIKKLSEYNYLIK